MNPYAALQIEEYRSRGILLDSNLLLLYLIGMTSPHLVGNGRYSKLSAFKQEQVAILRLLMARFRRVVTTAHVLTETSNLVNDLNEGEKQAVFGSFASTLEVIDEQNISSYQAAKRSEFPYLGLIDSVLAQLSKEFLIVSNDGRIVNKLRDYGLIALKWAEILGLSA